MSEEILKALTQLFAIITKQDGGVTEKEREYVIQIFKEDLDSKTIKEYIALYDQYVEEDRKKQAKAVAKGSKLTSVKDSVRTLAICKKINKTLTQKQKVVVVNKLLQLVAQDRKFSEQRMEIIKTVGEVFNIEKEEYQLLLSFATYFGDDKLLDSEEMLIGREEELEGYENLKYYNLSIQGQLLFISVNSVDMYFVRYLGNEELILNGFVIKPYDVNHFSHGSTLKTPKGDVIYYSDLVRYFLSVDEEVKLSFIANDIGLTFPNGAIGLRDINIAEGPGKLIGIMGASGAGKTTLLNVLAGIQKPTEGDIKINGVSIADKSTDAIEGVIGYIAQDDLLIEELTVYENLYYNAKLCFDNLNEEELKQKVLKTLENLGLDQRKDLRVGSVLDKTISGGQRKRLNIALELIREPSILFVDEPTSGLSSRDSENVVDLLKELSLKGKLIFVVIHQPSSDIYKMFDKMMIMDVGGYPVYNGPPVEAVTYFKRESNQVGSESGQCVTCGNVNPEQIFNIIDAKVVDEYGEFTNNRKVVPEEWYARFKDNYKVENISEVKELPEKTLSLPSKIKQSYLFTKRDLLSKISNKQYITINLLESPILAFLLAFVVRYKNDPAGQEYVFRFNENIPIYIMMAIIVALFVGLTVSAEEIIKDRKILKRESFLNLSWNSYLTSKVVILFALSAIQTFTFVIISNLILEIREMTIAYWIVLFSISCQANLLGLNISSTFDKSVTAYILIPFMIIPQMVLSGLLFPFDKMNDLISTKGRVPIIADVMSSRWAYEAIAVRQFKDNSYQEPFYDYEKEEMSSDFKASYWYKEMKTVVFEVKENLNSEDKKDQKLVKNNLKLLRNEIESEPFKQGIEDLNLEKALTVEVFGNGVATQLDSWLDKLKDHYQTRFNKAIKDKERIIYFYENKSKSGYDLNLFKNLYSNESLTDIVRNINTKNRIIRFNNRLVQVVDPIYNTPERSSNPLNYRTHFYAPQKYFLGTYWNTFWFNLTVIWIISILLYVALYFEFFRKILKKASEISFSKKR